MVSGEVNGLIKEELWSGIPVFWIEEHHEAYYCWGVAADKGYLKPGGNVLFHVDHHDDFECGGYFHDFTKPHANLEERKKFTYDCLGIADFIVPAIYEGLFDTMYNMKGLMPREFSRKERLVKRVGRSVLAVGDYVPFLHAKYRREGAQGYRFFTFCEGSLCGTPEMESVALDIDLDYFCWDDSLGTTAPKMLEITGEAYREYQADPYHPFRILPRRLLRATERGGRYYLCYEEPPGAACEADEACIQRRVDNFFKWLGEQPWKPSVVTLCRSAHSGYLPGNRAEWVEGLVRERFGF